jgi:hypothetical protein
LNKAVFPACSLIAALLITGCATQRAGQFSTFAGAGKSYAEAMLSLTEEAGKTAIDADSEILLQIRKPLDKQTRLERYQDQTKELKSMLDEMYALRRHTLLLKNYFVALSRLSETAAPTVIGKKTENLVASLQVIHPVLENAGIGETPVKDFIGSAVPIVVSAFRQKALEDELRKNAPLIERELDLQHAVLKALSVELQSDLRIIGKQKENNLVVKPYVAEGAIPDEWKETRREALTSTQFILVSSDNAAKAADKLKQTFIALVENKTSPDDFDELFTDINAMLDLVEHVQAGNKK